MGGLQFQVQVHCEVRAALSQRSSKEQIAVAVRLALRRREHVVEKSHWKRKNQAIDLRNKFKRLSKINSHTQTTVSSLAVK